MSYAACAIVTRMNSHASPSSVLSLRISADERAMLEAAAEQSRTRLSDFVRRRALESAEIDILNRSTVTIPAKDWDAFESWLARPAKAIPGLAELFARRPTWDR